ncbi:MAG: general stress protein [Bryobacteraceae bacterium]
MASATRITTVVGLFDRAEDARDAVRALRDAGVPGEDISLAAKDLVAEDRGAGTTAVADTDLTGGGTKEGASMGENIAGGAVFGGLGGLLIGIGVLPIPGIGPIVAAGPIATTLAGAGFGALGGSVVGAIRQAGVPEEEAHFYAESVRRGSSMVVVRASTDIVDSCIGHSRPQCCRRCRGAHLDVPQGGLDQI